MLFRKIGYSPIKILIVLISQSFGKSKILDRFLAIYFWNVKILRKDLTGRGKLRNISTAYIYSYARIWKPPFPPHLTLL